MWEWKWLREKKEKKKKEHLLLNKRILSGIWTFVFISWTLLYCAIGT